MYSLFLNFFQKFDNFLSYLTGNSCDEKAFLISKFKKKKISFIDIGANTGSFSDLILNNFNVKKAYLYEPSSSCFNFLIKKFGKIKTIKIINIGLSNQKKNKMFYDYKLSSQSSLYQLNKNFSYLSDINKKYLCKFDRFDNLNKKLRSVDLCKIDAQGEDFNILLGMINTLKKKKIKIIKIEVTFINYYKKNEAKYLKILNYLAANKYELINISRIKYLHDQIAFCDAYFELQK